VKHFVGNDTEWRRMEIESVMDEQTLPRNLPPSLRNGREARRRLVGDVRLQQAQRLPQHLQRGAPDRHPQEGMGISRSGNVRLVATESVDSIAKGLDLEMPMGYRITDAAVKNALAWKADHGTDR